MIIGKNVSSVIFLILTKCGITGQRARDKEREQKANRTEGGQSQKGKKKAGQLETKKKKGEMCENDSAKDRLRSLHR